MKNIRIGSRESRLAVVQSEMVMDYIKENCPEYTPELVTMKTTGDRILDRNLDQIGGKGLFVKELDAALMDGRSDMSVHSLKDMPAQIPEELPLIGFPNGKIQEMFWYCRMESQNLIFQNRWAVPAAEECCSFRPCIQRQPLHRSGEMCIHGWQK